MMHTAPIDAAIVAAERRMVIGSAREFIGTPFHHAARVRGAGVDCAQLLVAVFVGLALVEEPTIPFYTKDWFMHQDDEKLLAIIGQYCVPVNGYGVPGDVLTFRYGRAVSHAGILTCADPLTMIHSWHASGVLEEPVDRGHVQRFAGAWTLRRWAEAE